jgi:hypothetical protein
MYTMLWLKMPFVDFEKKEYAHCSFFQTLNRKKSLKTPREQPEYVHRRRTDNTMSKRKKSTKGQTTMHKTHT